MKQVEYSVLVDLATWLTEPDTYTVVKKLITGQPQIETIITSLGHRPDWTVVPQRDCQTVKITLCFLIPAEQLTWLLLLHPESNINMEL